MGFNVMVFREPRGVMRVIQFIFAIWAFATTTSFDNQVTYRCCPESKNTTISFSYPFDLEELQVTTIKCEISNTTSSCNFSLIGDFSQDAQFFVATGVLSMLYCMGIAVVYLMFEASYQSNALVPMADFLLTVLLAVFWLSGSAAWANGLNGLKSVTDEKALLGQCEDIKCIAYTGSYSTLNISVILGFLNFFLWAADLWFLYKETQWFKNAGPNAQSSASGITAA